MRVHVDAEKCQGHSRCVQYAPDVFAVDDDGYATEVGDGIVPDDRKQEAMLAVQNCPERAIIIDQS
jgi:ferredoxin